MTQAEIRNELHKTIDQMDMPHLHQLREFVSKLAEKTSTGKPLRKGGFAKNKFILSEDWDSPETNKEIEHLFNDGPLFPED